MRGATQRNGGVLGQPLAPQPSSVGGAQVQVGDAGVVESDHAVPLGDEAVFDDDLVERISPNPDG